jgi:hypothetical protein
VALRCGPKVAPAFDPPVLTSVLIDVPYADAHAADLSYALGLRPVDALKARTVEVGELRCELRILGCSHQVLVEGGAVLSETVACLPEACETARALPRAYQARAGDMRYRMVSRIGALPDRAGTLDELIERHAADTSSLVGVFRGDPHAFTALSARELPGGGVAWDTYHAYPQAGELVHTRSTLEPVAR